MANDAPRHPLRDALAGLAIPPAVPGEAPSAVDMVTGVVTQVDFVSTPHTIRVRLADGTITAALPYLGWWVPRVNDVAWMIRQGPALYPLGAIAPAATVTSPHRHAAADVDGTVIPDAPPPPVPAGPPPAPPTVRTIGITPVDMAYWSSFGWKADDLVQGGPNNRAFWFYGDQIAQAKGSGTIVAASIYVQRVSGSHGVNGGANLRLALHPHATRPGSGATPLGSLDVRMQLERGQAANVSLAPGQLAALNGGEKGLGLEPGASGYTSADYLRAAAGGASGQLSLTIQG